MQLMWTLAWGAPAEPAQIVQTGENVEVRLVSEPRWELLSVEVHHGSGHAHWEGTVEDLAALGTWIATPRPAPVRLTVCGRADDALARALAQRLVLTDPLDAPVASTWTPPPLPDGARVALFAATLLDDLPQHCRIASEAPADALPSLARWLEARW